MPAIAMAHRIPDVATPIRRLVQVDEYLRGQTRYAHLFAGDGRPDIVARIQAGADRNIRRYELIADSDEGARS